MDCALRFWSPSRTPHRGQEALAREFHLRRWQTTEDRVLLCVEEVARASTSSHLSWHFDGFMVHRDVPPVTSSQQFLDDLARHLRITKGFTISVDLKKHFSFRQLLVRTAQQTHRVVPPRRRAICAREWRWALVPRRWGARRACGWRQPVPRGWCVERWTASLCGTGSRP